MFYPKPGDTIVTRSGNKYTCIGNDEALKTLSLTMYKNYKIFGGSRFGMVAYKDHDGVAQCSEYDIIEIIPAQVEKGLTSCATPYPVEPSPITYPCLMQAKDGCIILFHAMGHGMVVSRGDDGDPLGMHSKRWAMDLFTPYIGTVNITQN